MKKILIVGSNSYIGKSFEKYISAYKNEYEVDKISIRNDEWKKKSFGEYDVIIHLAAIVHKKELAEMEELYYRVNTELAIEIAKKAKGEGVSQFVFFSTMAVYGEEGKIGQDIVINEKTTLNPKSYYAKSKVKAEEMLGEMNDNSFVVTILRPPMVYGENCPGNYARLEKLAKITPVFPMVENRRSVIDVIKLCEKVKGCIDSSKGGVILPQDEDYSNTSLTVKKIAKSNGKKIYLSKFLGVLVVKIFGRMSVVNKIFGNLRYGEK